MTDKSHTAEGCTAKTSDGRPCQRPSGHKQRCAFLGVTGENCTCMLRWYPNRCTAHPEQNQ